MFSRLEPALHERKDSDKGRSREARPAVNAVSITVGRTQRNGLVDEVPVLSVDGSELMQNPESEAKLDMEKKDDQKRGLEAFNANLLVQVGGG